MTLNRHHGLTKVVWRISKAWSGISIRIVCDTLLTGHMLLQKLKIGNQWEKCTVSSKFDRPISKIRNTFSLP